MSAGLKGRSLKNVPGGDIQRLDSRKGWLRLVLCSNPSNRVAFFLTVGKVRNTFLFEIAQYLSEHAFIWSGNGTVLVKDILPGSRGSNPGDLTNFNGTLFFSANDGASVASPRSLKNVNGMLPPCLEIVQHLKS